MKKTTLALFLFFSISLLYSQAQKNCTLVGKLTYADQLSDLWGYVDPDHGTEYAIVGTEKGLSIVSLANPAAPTEAFFVSGATSIWREPVSWGEYVYVTNEQSGGILIVDLSDLPNSIRSKDTTMSGIITSHSCYADDGILYINGANQSNGGLMMFDLTDPWRPTFIGDYTTRYVHDMYTRNNIAYLAEISAGRFTIVDITNKANPVTLSSNTYQNSFTHNTWLNDAGNVCFTTDEVAATYIRSWDVSNPANPTELGKVRSFMNNGSATPHNAYIKNDFIVASYYTDGIFIADGSRPNNLIQTGYYDTSPLSGGQMDGCWGAYPLLPSGLILASDMQEGLFVLQPNYVRACYLEGQVTDGTNGGVLSGVSITISATTPVQATSLVTGNYATGIADAGTYTVTYAKPGYISQTFTLALSNGNVTIQNVALLQATPFSLQVTVKESGTNALIGGATVLPSSPTLNYNFTTNASGVASGNMSPETYDIYVGKWGYRTAKIAAGALSTNTSYTVYLDKGYYDDFALNFGWTVTGTAPRGMWEKGEPVGTTGGAGGALYNPDLDVPNDFLDQCYVTGNGGGNVGDNDLDQGYTILTSPTMDLSAATNPTLSFSWWFRNADFSGQGTPNDYVRIDITNGTQTVTLGQFSGTSTPIWTAASYNIKSLIPLTATMKVLVRAEDVTPGHITEAGFDLFQITDETSNAIDELPANASLKAFPNPVNEQLHIAFDVQPTAQNRLSLSITDLQGKQILSKPLSSFTGEEILPFPYAKGVYLLSIRQDNHTLTTLKVVK